MKRSLVAGVVLVAVGTPLLVLAFAPAPDAGSRPVEYKSWKGYAESRDSGLKGDASYVALASKADFSRVFDPVLTPRGAPDAIPKDAFDTQLFVAVIKRDGAFWDYKVEKVTANGETLTVSYRATERKALGTAKDGTTAPALAFPLATAKAEVPRATLKAAPAPPTTERAPLGTKKDDARTEAARGPRATVDSTLIVSVPKAKYLSVVFIENGKKVGTARLND
jgi:hypothetical protein